MTLQEFLLTADADAATALQQARDYTEIQPVFITSNTMRAYIAKFGLYQVFTDEANDSQSAVRGTCLALLDSLRTESEFNLSLDLPLGQSNIDLFDSLIAAMPENEPAISNLKAALMVASNKTVYPFAGATLHEVLIIRDQCPQVTPDIVGNYAVIELTQDAPEKHNPRLMALNPRTGKWRHIGNFFDVQSIGKYDARIPPEFAGWQLAVDSAYGVL